MYSLGLSSAEGGLTLQKIMAEIPHDPAAIFLYLFLVASLGLIWWANRKTGGGDAPESPPQAADAADSSPERQVKQ